MDALLALLVGLLVGSFLNVCIHRLPKDLSVVRPRSYCPSCNAPIAWYDNIPLASYLMLRGRCRHCGARIPARYPLVEVSTGLLFLLIVAGLGHGLAAVKLCMFSALMVGLMFSDLEERILPDEFTLGGAAVGLLLSLVIPMDWGFGHLMLPGRWSERWLSLGESLLGVVLGSGLLWLVGVLYQKLRRKEGLGLGDVKMLAMIGAFNGLHGALQALIFGSLLGSVVGLVYIKLAKKDFSTYELPFGSFLGLTSLAVTLLGGPVARLLGWVR